MSYAGPGPQSPPGVPGEDPRYPLPPGDGRSRLLGGGPGTKAQRNVWVAVLSTVAFFGVLAIIVVRSPGWAALQQTFFDREVLLYSLPKILHRFVTDIFIFVVAECIVLGVRALPRGAAKSAGLGIHAPSVARDRLHRRLPWDPDHPRHLAARRWDAGSRAPRCAEIGAVLGDRRPGPRYSAYVAEVYRAGIESVHPSQAAAARSLGLSRTQSLRFVILPQAVRRVLPPLLNDFIGLQKDAALVFVLGVVDGLGQANIISSAKFDFTPFVALALVYLVITIPQTRFVDHMIQRDRRRRLAGGTT